MELEHPHQPGQRQDPVGDINPHTAPSASSRSHSPSDPRAGTGAGSGLIGSGCQRREDDWIVESRALSSLFDAPIVEADDGVDEHIHDDGTPLTVLRWQR